MERLALIKTFLVFSGVLLQMSYVHGVTSSPDANLVSNTTTTLHIAPNTTTHAPNTTTPHTTPNTTTHAPNITTTPHTTPNTTTHAPNTTTTPHTTPNTTTHAPNTTTHHTTVNTTTTPGTKPPTPTLPPKPTPPSIGNYSVKMDKDKGPCIIAVMGLELVLDKNKGYYNVVPKDTTATGKCSDDQANLNLTFPEGYINFMFVKNKNYYHIDAIAFRFAYGSGHWNGSIQNQSLLTTDNGYSVKCKHMPSININETKIAMFDVKLQAFDFTSGDFGKETSCSYDRNVIGLAVGLTVVILIIIGLISYLIYHKKKSSGYQRI